MADGTLGLALKMPQTELVKIYIRKEVPTDEHQHAADDGQ